MAEWVTVARVEDFRTHVLRIEHGGKLIALFKLKDAYYALEDRCSHELSALAGGRIVGRSVECPRHGARFDLATGRNLCLPAVRPVQSFPVKVEDGTISIQWNGGPAAGASG